MNYDAYRPSYCALLRFPLMVVVGSLALAACRVTYASPPTEKVVCTDAPRAQWMSEQQARAIFDAPKYSLVRFKVSRGNCHEFYAVSANGDVVEAYLHPITGVIVRQTRIPAPSSISSTANGVRP